MTSEPGRAGDMLFSYNPDVLLPPDVADQIGYVLESGYVGGNFRLRLPVALSGRWPAGALWLDLPGPMVSSARRWKERDLRTLLFWGGMQLADALRTRPWKLDRFYQSAR